MIVGVPRESFPGERRVALVPSVIPNLAKAGLEVLIEAGAGIEAGYPDSEYTGKGAKIASDRAEVFRAADVILQVLCYGSNDQTGAADLPLLRRGQVLIGFLRPLGALNTVQEIAATGATSFSVELVPRTTRAQSMDALSSMGTICGYKAVLVAAGTMPRIVPMLTTAAGTITPARFLIIGAGVAGLQAIATARRLGAVTSAYDLRPAAKEQVQSLGGRFVELPIEAKDAEDAGGYARAQDESFYKRCGDHRGRYSGKDLAGAGDARDGGWNGAGIRDRRFGGGARRQLRTDAHGRKYRRAWSHHHRTDQSCNYRSLSCEPDVRAKHHGIFAVSR